MKLDNRAEHPTSDPGDGREECSTCGKFVFLVIHSCKGVYVGKREKRKRHEA